MTKKKKNTKDKENSTSRRALFGETTTNWWDNMEGDPSKDWCSSSKRDFTRDGSPVVEWWSSDSMGLAPAAPARVNVGAAREKLLTSTSNSNWWDEELKLLEECTPVPDGIPAPPPPPPPPPGVPGAPPP